MWGLNSALVSWLIQFHSLGIDHTDSDTDRFVLTTMVQSQHYAKCVTLIGMENADVETKSKTSPVSCKVLKEY